MSLEDDFRAAIDKNISAEIGTALKERLEQAEQDAQLVKELRQANNQCVEDIGELQRAARDAGELEIQRIDQELKERELELKERVLNVTEAASLQNRKDLMLIVTQVFKGPASKQAFELYGNLSGLMSDHGMSSSPSATLSGSVGED